MKSISKKIISLVPSQSELLWDLGLREEIVGITKFCIHPPKMFNSVRRVGGTKNLNLELIRDLKPDLIIANKEENEKEQIEILQKEFNVHVTEIYSLEDSLKMIDEVGKLVGKKNESSELIEKIKIEFLTLPKFSKKRRVLYLIWKNPYMAAGKNTIIDNLLMHAGFENCVTTSRYPEITLQEIEKLAPEFIFLSSEPFPFEEKHFVEFNHLKNCKLKIVDGEMFSWYGSRLLKAPSYYKNLMKSI